MKIYEDIFQKLQKNKHIKIFKIQYFEHYSSNVEIIDLNVDTQINSTLEEISIHLKPS